MRIWIHRTIIGAGIDLRKNNFATQPNSALTEVTFAYSLAQAKAALPSLVQRYEQSYSPRKYTSLVAVK